MTGRRQVVDAILRIVADGPGAPAAYYACAVCPYTASAKGRETGPFVASIRSDHRATCPTLHPERTRAA